MFVFQLLSQRKEEDVNSYEFVVILRVSDTLESNKDKVKAILLKHGAVILSEDAWGVRRLAYMIDRENDGFYSFMMLESPPDMIQKVISEFRLNSDILRFLFVRIWEKKIAQ